MELIQHTALPWSVQLQRWWLAIFILAIPFSTGYLTEHPFAISPINIFSIGLIVLAAYNLLRGHIPFTPFKDRPTGWMLGLLFLCFAYALYFSDPLRSGIGFWVSRLSQPALVGFCIYQMVAAGVLQVEEFVAVLFYSIIPLLIGGFLQLIHVIPYQDPGRVSVAYRWPNTFARYLEVMLLLSLPWIVLRNKVVQWWKVAIWAMGVVILLTSKSYGGVASFTVGIFAMLLLLPKQWRKLQVTGLVSLCVILIIVGFNLPHLPKWQTSITSSRLTRLEFWAVAVQVIKLHFWTGIGIKGWQMHYPEFAPHFSPNHPPLNWGSEQPQNVFLDSFLKAGLPGFVAITTFLFWPIRQGWSLGRRAVTGEMAWFGLSVLGTGVALVAFGIIDDPLWSDDIIPLFFTLIFLSSWVLTQRRQHA